MIYLSIRRYPKDERNNSSDPVTLTMSLQRVCPVVIKVTDTNFEPAAGITVEVRLSK